MALAGRRDDHSFAFHGPMGHFTARKPRRRRGGMYWTAYRKVGGQVLSVYLGKSLALTAARLSEVATHLSERAASSERGCMNPALLTNAPLIGASPAVLATKLYRPQPRPGLVPRTHVLERLTTSEPAITLLSAPAGFGKSTLLSLCEGAGAALRPYLRVSRGLHKAYLHLYIATDEALVNTKQTCDCRAHSAYVFW